MNWVSRAWRRFVGDGKTLRHVVAMLSGTSIAQIVTVLATIPLARLYSPTDFGLFAIAQAIVLAGTSVAALRYDVAIVLPDKEGDARQLHRLASRTIAVVSAILAAGLLLASRWIGEQYHNSAFGLWLAICALIVYAMAQIANTQNWLIRTKNFSLIAKNRVTASILMVAMQLLLAPLIGGFEGLLLGMLIGQVATGVILHFRARDLRAPIPQDAGSLRDVAARYRKMPLLNAPNVLVDAVRNAGITFLIGNIAVGGLGHYSLANRAAQAPVFLVNGAIAQVFLQRMATTKPGGMVPLIRSLLLRIGLVSAPAFALFYFLAPWLFPFLFGSEWAESGLFAQALVPWLFLNTFTSPMPNVFIRAERQGWLLGFAVVYAVVPLAFLAMSSLPLLATVKVLAWIMTALLVCMLALSVVIARKFDQSMEAETAAV